MKAGTRLLASLSLCAVATTLAATLTTRNVTAAKGTGGNASANLDQCANGPVGAPRPCRDDAAAWQNGNVNSDNAHWYEGDSIPYRLRFSNIDPTKSHTVTIEWDTTKGGKHALDYLTSYDRSYESAETITWDPCGSCGGLLQAPAFPIATDPLWVTQTGLSADATSPSTTGRWDGVFTMFGGRVIGVSAPKITAGAYNPAPLTSTGDSSTSITITFTASTSNPVLAWGAHIASHADWPNASAVDITGSPFHMRLVGLDGSGGNQDRSSSSSAVIFPATITVTKDVQHNDGTPFYDEGTQSFAFTANGQPFNLVNNNTSNPPGNQKQFFVNLFGTANQLTITEDPAQSPGFFLVQQPNGIICTATLNGATGKSTYTYASPAVTITPQEGELINCTYVNKQFQQTLTVTKDVHNDHGGQATPGSFKLLINGNQVVSGVANTLPPGTYTVSEDLTNMPSGYTHQGIACGNSVTGTGSVTVTLNAGDNKTCTITNVDQTAHLTLVKHVTNDNGGQQLPKDFTLTATGPTTIGGPGGASSDVNAGNYTLSETTLPGYDPGAWSCSGGGTFTAPNKIYLAPGQSATCEITNDDQPATLTVIKHVINDNGGGKLAKDFLVTVTGNSPTPASFAGAEGGTLVTINAGPYSVDEGTHDGYAKSLSAGCEGDIANGGSATCTITNDDEQGTLIVRKTVNNNFGATKTASAFSFTVNGGDPISFVQTTDPLHGEKVLTVNAGKYSVVEVADELYNTSSSNCSDVIVSNGGTQICEITNSDGKAKPKVASTMSWVLHDSLAITGIRGGLTTATVTFKLYGSDDVRCEGPVLNIIKDENGLFVSTGEVVPVVNGAAATVKGFSLGQLDLQNQKGTFRWIAEYSGDDYNEGTATSCGEETHTITVGEPTPPTP
jgi:hypothetical protein